MEEMTENSDPLDLLLLAASEVLEKESKTLKETDLFQQETNVPKKVLATVTKNSLIHAGDTDSSEDEDSRNWEVRKYSENGREIKRLLENKSSSSYTKVGSLGTETKRISHVSTWNKPSLTAVEKEKSCKINPVKNIVKPETSAKFDVYIDPIFGLRIINPLVSSSVLQDRMVGREPVTFTKLSRFLQIKTKDKDWVLAAVLVNKSIPKTSQKGTAFSVWTLSDLKDDIKTVAVFLFSSAHTQLWKTTVGTVVGLLNPEVLDNKYGKDQASLSINNAQKVMIFGQSKDFGTCKSVKKNGDKCLAIVNTSICEYCVYHIKQEYQKCSVRSDLQSSFGGRGLTALRNKVLGKNEVFYAGKSYTAIPAKKSRKLEQKDNNTLNGLLGKGTIPKKSVNGGIKKRNAPMLEVSHAQRVKDLQLLDKLSGMSDFNKKTAFEAKESTDITLEDAKHLASSVLSKLKAKKQVSEIHPTISKSPNLMNKNEQIKSSSPNVLFDDSKSVGISSLNESTTRSDNNEHKSNSLPKSKRELSSTNLKNKQIVDKNLEVENQLLTMHSNFEEKTDNTHSNIKNKLSETKNSNKLNIPLSGPTGSFPKLSGFDSGVVDLSKPSRRDKAKLHAIKVIQKVGPIKKVDPNNIRGTGIKRPINVECESEAKKIKVETNSFATERFKKIMAAASNHQDLLEARDEEEKEKYFFKLETKEKMEEKMISTQKIACKAVKCLQCKYVSFSASDMCKSERHPLKVFDAFKRFYKCANCQTRTACLEIVPLKPCNNCGSLNWKKTGMMKEKLVTASHTLSIRGGEQKNLNSVIIDNNVNLLVPD